MEDDVRRASTTSKRCAALEETNAFLQAEAGAARDALATTSPDYFAYDWNLNTQ